MLEPLGLALELRETPADGSALAFLGLPLSATSPTPVPATAAELARRVQDALRELTNGTTAANPSGVFFLHRIPGWEKEIRELHRGPNARIQVPNPTLFVLLKIRRLTEADLSDCLAMLELAREENRAVDTVRLEEAVRDALGSSPSPGRSRRLAALQAAL